MYLDQERIKNKGLLRGCGPQEGVHIGEMTDQTILEHLFWLRASFGLLVLLCHECLLHPCRASRMTGHGLTDFPLIIYSLDWIN